MKTIELLESNIKVIDSASTTAYELAAKMFKELDKGEVTDELKLLTNIGASCAAVKVCYNKLSGQLAVLKELQEEKANG